MNKKTDSARKNIFKKSNAISGISIKGYNFNQGINYQKIIESFSSTGLQASEFSKSINLMKEIIKQKNEHKEKMKIFLGYTSNMVSSGLRDIFRYLVEKKKVDVIVTTAGGIEEDFIKCFGNFKLGSFNSPGKELRKNATNRIGNIFVPNDLYCKFEKFLVPILNEMKKSQIKNSKPISPKELIWKIGEKIGNPESIYYWAHKNKIPIYCPAISDGSLGDIIYFFKHNNPEFIIDTTEDTKNLNDETIGLKKSAVIILGSGIVKHSILNANLFRNGADYALYLNNSQEFDGSDSGATPDEAVSWGKLTTEAKSIKIFGDASILFPILVAETFAKS